ncbi:cuticle protein-like [Pollicipes pollicipes]|uniref:cuticle protein-like n=1 Tax=Pollicipes pollicipes TaxID=41117 RepID=UPI0018851E14|nr:cuticle protein-like [Pollicipes pollicipes]
MYTQAAVAFVALCAVGVLAAPPGRYPSTAAPALARYQFQYVVSDEYAGLEHSRAESRDGDQTTGSYRVLLPDGRVQHVQYIVDGDQGYAVEVSYEGEARPYQPVPRYPPRYRARTYTLGATTEAPLPATPETPAIETVQDSVEPQAEETAEQTETASYEAETAAEQTETASHEPETAPEQAETVVEQTEIAAYEPETAAEQEETAAYEPETAAEQTETVAYEPETAAEQAETAAYEPETAAEQTEIAAYEPETEAEQPETAVEQAEAELAQTDAEDAAPGVTPSAVYRQDIA